MGRVDTVTPQEEEYAMKSTRILITVIGLAAVTMLLWNARANADAIEHYRPNLLTKAERALERGRPDQALSLLGSRVDSFTHATYQAQGYSLICRAWYEKGDYHKAERACDIAVQLDSGTLAWSHLNNRGVMRLLVGNTGDAVSDFHAAARRNPTAWAVHRNLFAAMVESRREKLTLTSVF